VLHLKAYCFSLIGLYRTLAVLILDGKGSPASKSMATFTELLEVLKRRKEWDYSFRGVNELWAQARMCYIEVGVVDIDMLFGLDPSEMTDLRFRTKGCFRI
jgi:hypothetical protein